MSGRQKRGRLVCLGWGCGEEGGEDLVAEDGVRLSLAKQAQRHHRLRKRQSRTQQSSERLTDRLPPVGLAG